MKLEDAMRKIKLLRQVNIENGSSAAEAEIAASKVKALMERYMLRSENVKHAQEPASQLTWVYWQELFNEFGIQFTHFGHHGSASLGSDRTVYIKLNTGQWWLEERLGGGLQTTARDRGVASLRKYLKDNARGYSFLKQ